MGVRERSWVSHYIVPCPGDASCKYCKPGEPHPQQHAFSRRVTEPAAAESIPLSASARVKESSSSMQTYYNSVAVSSEQHRFLKKRKLIGSIFGNLQLIAFDPELDPEPFNCYNCWSDEHLRRDCPEPPLHVYCRNCGRRDVEVQHCPRCAEAYREFVKQWDENNEERRRLSAALYKSRQFYREEELCSVRGADESEQGAEDREADDGCCDFEVMNASQASVHEEEFSSAASEKMLVEDECWTDFDEDEDEVYRSVRESFASTAEKSENEHYETVASFVMSSHNSNSSEDRVIFVDGSCSETDYESTQAGFFRESDSVNSDDEYEEKSSDASSASLQEDECPAFSESFRAERDAQLNELFVYIRNKKIQEEFAAEAPQTPAVPKRKSLYCFDEEAEEDVNYDDVIVDENERSESLCSQDYAIQEFLDLLDAVKHLPIEVQNVAVLHFVSERKKQFRLNQEKMLRQCESEFSGL